MTDRIKDCCCMANKYLVGYGGARRNHGGARLNHGGARLNYGGAHLNQPVPVTVIFLDKFGARRTHFTVSRQAHDQNWNVLYDEIDDWLVMDDIMIWDVSGIRVEATDDEAGRPYAAHLLFNRGALPAGVLDRPRGAGLVDYGLVLNRQMNIRDYINEQLYNLLYSDMLNLDALDATIPASNWTITIAARDMQYT